MNTKLYKEANMSEELLNKEISEEPKTRQNPFTVISKTTFGDYSIRNIEQNSSWSTNVYGNGYVIVPDNMVPDIMETKGFCDIELNADGTEVISFTPREIPYIPQEELAPTTEERITILEECCTELMYQNALQTLGITEEDL